ncbi:VCBS domain-containing protein [Dechloromonas sp. HYN0024]|uniref:VCBS domain-containing protein n=1 Tax=Dechloromonas sp. HYN0024 TaxID=2231055 RepID=UPI000E43AFD3|nr:VCBS domain-containing protein [Dechloromonas sp. HYN0024]AXS79455.1 DUF4347 domain-containing protein [Dechloromonas sp. HYN0024]
MNHHRSSAKLSPTSQLRKSGLQRRKPSPLALEQRLMFDGAAVATAAPDPIADTSGASTVIDKGIASTTDTSREGALAASQTPSREVAFIDTTVENWQALAAGVKSGVEIVLLTSGTDGIEQIANFLGGKTGFDAIHILSHGTSGELLLGGKGYTADMLSQYQQQFSAIGSALSDSGDILLYGCDIAQGTAGEAFINAIASATSADIAASTDATGNTALGGNWTLEATAGTIESSALADPAALAAFDGLLAPPVNRAPVAVSDANVTTQRNPVSGSVLSNDTDADGDTLNVTRVDSSRDQKNVSQGVGTTTVEGVYGNLVIDKTGGYTYTPNSLTAGSYTDTFTYTVTDGKAPVTANLVIDITVSAPNSPANITASGSEDTRVIEAGSLVVGDPSAGGKLTVSDPDAGQSKFQTPALLQGTYGTFTFATDGTWTYALDPALSDKLNSGQSASDSLTVKSFDGSAQRTITVNITGSQDIASLTSASTGLTETNAELNTGGTLTVTDKDATAATVVSQTGKIGTYGSFSVAANGVWTYTTNSALDSLNAGQIVTDNFTVATTDGGTATVSITITGSQDVSTLPSATAALTEMDAALTTSGKLNLADKDATAATVVAQAGALGNYGTFSVNASGDWSYTTNGALDSLNARQVVTDTFTVATTDGASAQVTVNITGSEDRSTLANATVALTEANDVLSTGGTLTLTDKDATAATVITQTTSGAYGTFAIKADGSWTYVTNSALDSLNAGQNIADIFTVATTDGVFAQVTVNIAGSQDIATLTSATATLIESNATQTTGGKLVLTDKDAAAATVIAQTARVGTYGNLTVKTDGTWTYTTNGALDTLNAGQLVTDTFTVATTDGGSAQVIINITGSEDIATLSGATPKLTETNAVRSASGKLVVTDKDATDATVVTQTGTAGTYGSFSVQSDGSWTYNTNGALDFLDAGQKVTDSFIVATTDGGSATVLVTITGSQDKATLSSAAVALTETDATQSTGGKLTVTDKDATAATVVAQTAKAGTYGSFSILADGSWTYTTNGALDTLNAGQKVTDTFAVATTDGGTATVKVTITGTQDVASLSSATVNLTETDAAQSTGGTLTVTDKDATAATVVAQTGKAGLYGTFSVKADGTWTYAMNSALDALNAGQKVSDSFTVKTTDGGSATVVIDITGSEDIASLSNATVALTETDAAQSTGGTLTLSDKDATAATIVANTITSAYGTFAVKADGSWTYATNGALDALNAGQKVSDSFTVGTSDGGSATVLIDITGSEDVASLSSATVALTETDATQSTGGTLTVTDKDATAATLVANTTAGTYGTFAVQADGTWTYATNDALDALNAGQKVSESFTVRTSDGASATVSIDITGSEDIASLSNASVTLTETDAAQSTGGTLTLTDKDATAATIVANTAAGTYGTFAVKADGSWTYATNGALDALNAGNNVVDSFTVATSDGGTATVTVNIAGTNDAPVAKDIAGAVSENGAAITLKADYTDVDAGSTATFTMDTTGTKGTVINNGDGTFSYDPNGQFETLAAGEKATDSFTYTVNDGQGGVATRTATITLTGENDAPVANGTIADQATIAGDAFTLQLPADLFSDIDRGDQLTVSARLANGDALPTWLKFDPETQRFTGVANNADVGKLDIIITATDKSGATQTLSYGLNVSGRNATVAGTQTTGTAADSNGTSGISGSDVPKVTGLRGNFASGRVPGANDNVTGETAPVFDPNALINAAPTAAGPQDLDAGDYLRFELAALDTSVERSDFVLFVPTGGKFTFTLPADFVQGPEKPDFFAVQNNGEPLPEWLKFDPVTGKFIGKAPNDLQGSLRIQLTGKDAQGRDRVIRISLTVEKPVIADVSGDHDKLPAGKSAEQDLPRGRTGLSEQIRLAAKRGVPAERLVRSAVSATERASVVA